MELDLLKTISETTGIKDLSNPTNVELAKISLQMKALSLLEKIPQQKKEACSFKREPLLPTQSGKKLSPEFNSLIEELSLMKKTGSNLQFKNVGRYLKVSAIFKDKSTNEAKEYFSRLRDELKLKFGIPKGTKGEPFPYWPLNFEAVEQIGVNQDYHENLFDVPPLDIQYKDTHDPKPITF